MHRLDRVTYDVTHTTDDKRQGVLAQIKELAEKWEAGLYAHVKEERIRLQVEEEENN